MAFPNSENDPIQQALEQANAAVPEYVPEDASGNLFRALDLNIDIAREVGMSDQQVAVQFYEAARAAGLSLLYPFEVNPGKVKREEIVQYLTDLQNDQE